MPRQKKRKPRTDPRKSLRSPGHRRICSYLKEARRKASLTQDELAAKIGWTQQDVSKVEVGERRIDVVEVIEYAGGAGFDPCDLVLEVSKVIKRRRRARKRLVP